MGHRSNRNILMWMVKDKFSTNEYMLFTRNSEGLFTQHFLCCNGKREEDRLYLVTDFHYNLLHFLTHRLTFKLCVWTAWLPFNNFKIMNYYISWQSIHHRAFYSHCLVPAIHLWINKFRESLLTWTSHIDFMNILPNLEKLSRYHY